MEFLNQLVKGIAAQFGKKCEVVLHDYAQPYDKTIVLIENSSVTGRKIGDCGTNLGLEILRGKIQEGDKYNYITQTKDGKILKSTSLYLKNEEKDIIGSLCINWDITEFYACEATIRNTIMVSAPNENVNEIITDNVSELMDSLIQESIKFIDKPVKLMEKEDKIRGVKYLDDKGVFLIKKSSDRVAKFYGISKNTLYNYLDFKE